MTATTPGKAGARDDAVERARRTVAELADIAGVQAPAIKVARAQGLACIEGRVRCPRLRIDPALLEAPESVLRGQLAHEVAHLAVDDLRRTRRRFFVTSAPTMAVAWGGVALALVERSLAPVMLTATVVVGVLTWLLRARSERGDELSADRRSVVLLGESEPARQALTWPHPRGVKHPGNWIGRRFSSHPPLEERLAAVHGTTPDAPSTARSRRLGWPSADPTTTDRP